MKRFSVKLLWGIGIFLFCLAAILGAVHFFGSDKTIEFRDIDTDYVYYDEDGGFFHYSHSFLINNCPADTTETYEAISEYAHSHFDYDSYASLMEELQQDRNVKELYIFARFFKVSSTLPWDWQPKYADGILTNDDDIDKHLNDCVGSLSISPVNDRGDLEIEISVYPGTAKEFSAKEIWRSNRPVTETDPAEPSLPENDAAQTTENPKEALENLLDGDGILFCAVDDFDNDGSYEAFAFQGEPFSDGVGAYGSILYAANEEITVVRDDAVYDELFVFEVGDGTKYLCLRVNDAWNPSLIYGVKDGLPEQTVLSDIGPWFTILSENEFTLCHSTLDGISLGGGHTGKPYYFYYDNGFREYGATEISVEEFREYDPSSDYLSYIEEKDGEIRSILRRSNHLIHVNYRCAIPDALQPVWQNYYLTFREQDGNLTLVEENIGIYLAAMVPEIAVYEDGGEPAGGESNIHALRKDKCTRALVDSFQSGIVNEQKGSLEQKIIYSLMDRDVICYYAFRYASSAIEEEARYRDDIFEIKKHALFRDYSELKNFVHDTYTEENAERLLKERDSARALYFSEDQRFLYQAENLGIVNFDIFSEGYEIEITHADDDEIEFICYYSVWQDEEMKPIEKAALCRAKIEGSQWKLDRNGWLNEQEKRSDFSSSGRTLQTGGNINREITGLDFEALNANEAIFGRWSNDSFTFDAFTYAVEYDGETYTTETDPERFNENFRAIEEKWEKSDQRYKKINFGEQIGEAEVTECSYTCESFDGRDGIRTEPFRAALTLSGTVTLKGVIAYAEEGDDYWNVYADTVLFFPYADSLKESRMPLLHTEKIDTVYYENGMPAFGFYGETLPFELGGSTHVIYNGKTFGELFGAKKFREATIQFEEVVQSWMYMNGSGWSPCKAKITKITFDSEPRCNGNELLCPPFNRTLESYNKEWSEDDVIAAWNMTDASEVYMEYTDRLFCDLDRDGSAELLLTSYSTKKMYFFKKTNHRIELLFERVDIDITNGNVIMPPTDKETIKTKEVFDFQKCHSFQLYHKEENIYVMGISWRPAVGKTCWVKKLTLSNDNIGFDDVFRWGMFTERDRIASVFEYRRYDCNGNYTYTTQREIDHFLQLLYSGNDETAKDDG